MIKISVMKNAKAMQALKRGEFKGYLIEFHTTRKGDTVITTHTKDEGEKKK